MFALAIGVYLVLQVISAVLEFVAWLGTWPWWVWTLVGVGILMIGGLLIIALRKGWLRRRQSTAVEQEE